MKDTINFLAGMILGAAIGQKIALMYQLNSSAISVICSFSFLFFAFLLIRWVGKKLSAKKEYRAKIIRIRSPEIQVQES